MNFGNMKVAHRFGAMIAIMLTGFLVYGGFSLWTLNQLKVNGPVYRHIVQGKDLVADILPPPEYVIESYLVSLQLKDATAAERTALAQNLHALKTDYESRRAYWLGAGLDASLRHALDDADRGAQGFYLAAFDQYLPALEKGDRDGAAAALGIMKQQYGVHRNAINQLVEAAGKLNDAGEADARATIVTSTRIMVGILVAGALAVGAFSMFVARGLLRQLGGEPHHAAAIAGRIAAGDLAVPVGRRPANDRSLLGALGTMRNDLARIVGHVREGASAISTASSQIASGNLDLSSRTEKQASALGETAAAVEQLTNAVRQNADHAHEARRLADEASEAANAGGAVMSQMIARMDAISVSSKQIASIISVIESIAFQTNILALNAAVEAARAGEQGKGFAVVATEVRNLAQRAAVAAKEIDALIVSSVGEIDSGVKLVNEAGGAMQRIVSRIQHVTGVVGEISEASREQSGGIQQIHDSVTRMDEVTQQNAALVEEAAAAADALHDQVNRLNDLVDVFVLE